MSNSFQAQCPCGQVTLQIVGAALGQVYCHCDDCQNAHGAAYVPRSIHQKRMSLLTQAILRNGQMSHAPW